MKLNDVNEAWIERVSLELGREPCATLNIILRAVRKRVMGKDIKGWVYGLEVGGGEDIDGLTRRLFESCNMVERAARTAQIYLEQVNRQEGE